MAKGKKVSSKKSTPILEEMSQLGKALGAAVKAAGQNPELKSSAHAAFKDLETAAGRFGSALKKAVDSPEARSAQKQAKKVLDSSWAKATEATQKYRATLAGGLKKLSGELHSLADKLSK